MEVLGAPVAAHPVFSVVIPANLAYIRIPPASKVAADKCYYGINGTDMKSFFQNIAHFKHKADNTS